MRLKYKFKCSIQRLHIDGLKIDGDRLYWNIDCSEILFSYFFFFSFIHLNPYKYNVSFIYTYMYNTFPKEKIQIFVILTLFQLIIFVSSCDLYNMLYILPIPLTIQVQTVSHHTFILKYPAFIQGQHLKVLLDVAHFLYSFLVVYWILESTIFNNKFNKYNKSISSDKNFFFFVINNASLLVILIIFHKFEVIYYYFHLTLR